MNSQTIELSSDSSNLLDVRGYIFEIQKLSTEDGPGIRTTVFLKECPLKCVWCHNPESIQHEIAIQWFATKCIACEECLQVCTTNSLHFEEGLLKINRETCEACGSCVEACPTTALKASGQWYSAEEVLQEILKDKAYYDKSNGGVTFSGGEPTLQAEFLVNLLQECKSHGVHTAVDTCGLASQKTYQKIFPYVDLFLLDIKEIDPQRHLEYAGVNNKKILENIQWLAQKIELEGKDNISPKKQMWIRTPIIPGYTARDENVVGIGQFIVQNLNNAIERWDLLAFNNLASAKYERLDLDWPLKETVLLTKNQMEHFHQLALQTGVKLVEWDGLTQKT